jgi:hypothetical protein
LYNIFFLILGFTAQAAYAAYAGRGYSSYPGFGLPGGLAGYPAGRTPHFFFKKVFYKTKISIL